MFLVKSKLNSVLNSKQSLFNIVPVLWITSAGLHAVMVTLPEQPAQAILKQTQTLYSTINPGVQTYSSIFRHE